MGRRRKVQVDDNIMKWVDDSKKLVDAKEAGTFDMWSDDWSKGFYPDGKYSATLDRHGL